MKMFANCRKNNVTEETWIFSNCASDTGTIPRTNKLEKLWEWEF